MMHLTVILFWLLQSLHASFTYNLCPAVCNPIACRTGVVSCSDPGLTTLPYALPSNTRRIIIANQLLTQPHLNPSNFTTYSPPNQAIVKLTIQHCGLLTLAPYTFSQLTNLSILDLSFNQISNILVDTFHSLNLIFLRLDENRPLVLHEFSFRGLEVIKLSMIDCELRSLPISTLMEISGSLKKLHLNRNKLKSLDIQMKTILRHLEVIQLEDNLWECKCVNLWLVELTKSQPMSGRICDGKIQQKLSCYPPKIDLLDVLIYSRDSLKLICFANDPFAQVQWYQNDLFNVTKSIGYVSQGKSAVIVKNDVDNFDCKIINDYGNVTLNVLVKWPIKLMRNTTTDVIKNPIDTNPPTPDSSFEAKRFTLLEMLGSIIATFTLSMLLFLLVYRNNLTLASASTHQLTQSHCIRNNNSSNNNANNNVALHAQVEPIPSYKWWNPSTANTPYYHQNSPHNDANHYPASPTSSDLSQTYDVPQNAANVYVAGRRLTNLTHTGLQDYPPSYSPFANRPCLI